MQAQVIRVTRCVQLGGFYNTAVSLRVLRVVPYLTESQGKTTLYIDCAYIIVVSLQCELFNVLCYSHNRKKTQAALLAPKVAGKLRVMY
jgi:hypothetical protein